MTLPIQGDIMTRYGFELIGMMLAVLLCGNASAQEVGVLTRDCMSPASARLSTESLHIYWKSVNEQARVIADDGKQPKSTAEWVAERFSVEGFYQVAGENKWRTAENRWMDVDERQIGVKLEIPFDAISQVRREASARRASQEGAVLAESKARGEFYKKFVDLRLALATAENSKARSPEQAQAQAQAEKVALDISALSRAFSSACLAAPWQNAMRD